MEVIKVRKAGDTVTVTLPAKLIELIKVHQVGDELSLLVSLKLIEALRLMTKDEREAVQQIIDEIVLRQTTPEGERFQPSKGHYFSSVELMQLPLEERHRLLAAAAVEAAQEYHTNPELMEFSAALDGEDWEEMDG